MDFVNIFMLDLEAMNFDCAPWRETEGLGFRV